MGFLIQRAYSIYYYLVVVAGFSILGLAIAHVCMGGFSYEWIVFACLTALSGHFAIKLPAVKSRISVSYAFIFANIILFGPWVGSVTAALEGFLGSIRSQTLFSQRLKYTLFNVATMAASSYLSGIVLFSILGPLYGRPATALREIMLPVLVMALVHYLSNTIGVSIIVAIEVRENLYKVWREKFRHTSLSYFAGALAAALIVTNIHSLSLLYIGLILPILYVTYFAYKTYHDKAEENAYRLQLDKLYLRTVEVLSVAIDARESGTLGHSKRVRVYANGLARAANVTDDKVYRGIEAAALLLDIGNLAIPEYILNNPGELSGSELQKVRIHPVVGANILANIIFPYPLTEYVRHHHERWDGLGYPDRLQGDQIPLGARILSIADCFDALTCERPYQRAHSKEQALTIMRSRIGTYYDPNLAAKFEQIVDDLIVKVKEIEASEAGGAGQMGFGENTRGLIEKSWQRSNELGVFGDIASTQKEVYVLYELSQALGSTLSVPESLAIIASKLAKLISFNTCVIYAYSEETDRLKAEYAAGANAGVLKDHFLEVDNSLSGWVLNEKEPVINANAAGDLSSVKKELVAGLEHALVFPLIMENKCNWTISLYSSRGSKFKPDDLRVLATVAPKAAAAIQNAMRFEEAQEMAVTDPLTSLPNMRHFRYFFEKELAKARRHEYRISILGMDLDGFKDVNDRFGHPVGDRMLVEIAGLLKGILREEDLVVRCGGDEFIAVLVQTDRQDALQLSVRIQKAIDDFRLEISPGKIVQIGISMGCASYPEDGETLESLLKRADIEMYRNKRQRRARVS